MDLNDLKEIIRIHQAFWTAQRPQMRAYTQAYQGKILRGDGVWSANRKAIIVETPDGYIHVESYISSLFAKSPAVAVQAGPDDKGNPHLVEKITNRFLVGQFNSVKQTLRNALIYPFAAIKMGTNLSLPNPLDRISLRAIQPWDVVVDMAASQWEDQRYVGHHYHLTMDQAKRSWKGRQWTAAAKTDYLSSSTQVAQSGDSRKREAAVSYNGTDSDASTALSWVEVWEIYDLEEGKVMFYSPNLKSRGDGLISKIKIPFKNANGTWLCPIVPLYLNDDPEYALKGCSALGRVYDQLWEKANLRTTQANSLRRDARILLTRGKSMGDSAVAAFDVNADGTIIPLEIGLNDSLANAIVPLQWPTLSTDFDKYEMKIQQDLDRGNILNPATRGIATNVTATEIAALTQYTSSEIGKMARQRDLCIEGIANTYIRMLYSVLDAEDEKSIVTVDGTTATLTCDVIAGDYRYAAADQTSTPLSSAIRRQRFVEVLPILLQLGVPKEPILDHLVREYDLPKEFTDAARAALQSPPPGDGLAPASSGAPLPGIPVGGGQVAADIKANGPMNEGEY